MYLLKDTSTMIIIVPLVTREKVGQYLMKTRALKNTKFRGIHISENSDRKNL